MFYADDAKTVFTLFADFGFDRLFRLFGALFTIGRQHQIENQIYVGFPDGHTEIV